MGILTGEPLKNATKRDGTKVYGVMAVTGEFMGHVPGEWDWETIDNLIDHRLIYGKGQPTSCRHFRMDVEMSVALEKLGADARFTRAERGSTPLEVMRRYMASRKTTIKGHVTVQHGNRVFHAEYFEHKDPVLLTSNELLAPAERFRGEAA